MLHHTIACLTRTSSLQKIITSTSCYHKSSASVHKFLIKSHNRTHSHLSLLVCLSNSNNILCQNNNSLERSSCNQDPMKFRNWNRVASGEKKKRKENKRDKFVIMEKINFIFFLYIFKDTIDSCIRIK